MFAEPITIEKDDEVFDIFFVDSEGLLPKTSTAKQPQTERLSSQFNDSFTTDLIGDRQKRLLSVLLSISTFVIYNGKLGRIDKDLEAMAVPSELCSLADKQTSLLWLMRDVDRESESTPADTYV